MSQLRYDREASSRLERAYTTPDVQSQRDEVRRSLAVESDERVLDLGSGPGILSCELAALVGPDGWITAVDISEEMNAIAARRISEHGFAGRVEVVLGDAAALTFPDAYFDAAVATQVIEYVDAVEAALHELRRVLRPGGRFVVLDTDWDTLIWAALNERRSARVLEAWSAHAAHASLPRTLGPLLRRSGFAVEELRVIPLLNTSYNENTYSYNLAALIADFVKNRQSLPSEEVEGWLAELRELDQTTAYFFSLNRYLFRATRTP